MMKGLKVRGAAVAATLAACIVPAAADAAMVQLTFRGTVTETSGEWLDLLGSEISLSFRYDTATPPTSTVASGSLSSTSTYSSLFQSLQVSVDGQTGQAFSNSSIDVASNGATVRDFNAAIYPPGTLFDSVTAGMTFNDQIATTITNPPPCGGRGQLACEETVLISNTENLFEYRSSYLTGASVGLSLPIATFASSDILDQPETLASLSYGVFPAATGTLGLTFADRSGEFPAFFALNADLNSVELAPVPLPAAAWLLLSGIGALGFLRRRADVRS